MVISDLELIENGDGGDFILAGNDIKMVRGFQNMPYIALFGGNLESNTAGAKETEQATDFWGNFLLYPTNQAVWLNSETERTLNNISLSSSTRILIEEQVRKDLKFMEEFATVNVSVSLLGNDKIGINVELIEPTTNEITQFSYIWDAMQAELVSQGGTPQVGDNYGLDSALDYDL